MNTNRTEEFKLIDRRGDRFTITVRRHNGRRVCEVELGVNVLKAVEQDRLNICFRLMNSFQK